MRVTIEEFHIYTLSSMPRRKFELIGGDGNFTMERTVLVEDAYRFKLDI